jgi:O-acetylserine/cysteine efflux transporter
VNAARRDTALAVLVALIWGTNFVAIRSGIDAVPPFLFLAMRFVVVCVPAVLLVRRPQLPWRGLSAPLLPSWCSSWPPCRGRSATC